MSTEIIKNWKVPYEILKKVTDDTFDRVYLGVQEYHGSNPFYDIPQVLDNIFYVFNCEHPEDYTSSSLSVGDVICLGEVAFQVIGEGFKGIDLSDMFIYDFAKMGI